MISRRLLCQAAWLLVLAACTKNSSSESGFTGGDGSYTFIPEEERQLAPVLTGRSIFDEPLSSTDYPGKVLVINVWGSWCAPCRHEAPNLAAAAKQTADVAQFLGINTRDLNPAQAQTFVKRFGIEFPNFYDPDGTLLLEFSNLPPKAIPSTIFIDPKGRLAARILGEASTATLVGAISDIEGKQ